MQNLLIEKKQNFLIVEYFFVSPKLENLGIKLEYVNNDLILFIESKTVTMTLSLSDYGDTNCNVFMEQLRANHCHTIKDFNILPDKVMCSRCLGNKNYVTGPKDAPTSCPRCKGTGVCSPIENIDFGSI